MTNYLCFRGRDRMSAKGISLGPKVAGDLNPSFLTMRHNRVRAAGVSLEEAYIRYAENYPSLPVLDIPTIASSTAVIAETPVAADAVALSALAVPAISVSTVVKYKATYDGNGKTGGSVPTDANWYAAGATVTVLTKNTLVKTGYTFDCWNTQADGGGTDYAPAATFELAAATKLYAQWVAA